MERFPTIRPSGKVALASKRYAPANVSLLDGAQRTSRRVSVSPLVLSKLPLAETGNWNASTRSSVWNCFVKPVRGSITTLPVTGSVLSFSNSFTRAVTAESFSAGMRASFHVTCGVLT